MGQGRKKNERVDRRAAARGSKAVHERRRAWHAGDSSRSWTRRVRWRKARANRIRRLVRHAFRRGRSQRGVKWLLRSFLSAQGAR
jgi:N-acetyl-anhydromuramyl-L-alanine amidase AmpD